MYHSGCVYRISSHITQRNRYIIAYIVLHSALSTFGFACQLVYMNLVSISLNGSTVVILIHSFSSNYNAMVNEPALHSIARLRTPPALYHWFSSVLRHRSSPSHFLVGGKYRLGKTIGWGYFSMGCYYLTLFALVCPPSRWHLTRDQHHLRRGDCHQACVGHGQA